ncbi:murein biosynthesis integral membrane protein MurJ [Sediminibacillus dalangtanensis]|uniref:Lipid II flippase n=1 Tax=Sediminibacillus dalangtanensis TaxID=2729421 RepID=A0ABX7VV14_9BACI|nr:murein biosynthesis integral membrane protein MurJ [Sediminibacillus dalangtanensis]QTN00820.1 murein biosynthesis integral membrane protein MurJ [Sediminibacillus dalangtanensis]
MKSKLGATGLLFLLMTLLLKISGLVRDMVIAYYFGDSYQADAFLAAFIIPNMLFLFMTNGMKNTLVPSYLEAAANGRENSHLSQVFKVTAVGGTIAAVLGMLLSPYLIPLLYTEFSEQATRVAIWVSVWLMGALVFVGLNAVLEAYLDARQRFSTSAASQIIVIAAMITSAFLFAESAGPYALAAGYLAGTIVSLLFKLILAVPKQAIRLKEKINTSEIKHFYRLFLPVALTVMVGQINLAVDNIFAGYFPEGTVTYINYAKNLVHFPQAIFGVTIATLVFPALAKAQAIRNQVQFKQTMVQGLNLMYLLVLPAITGMMILMPQIIELLYERGAFTHQATLATSQAAYYYFGSVLFFSLNTMINKGFYSVKQGKLIMKIGAVSVVLNLLFNYLFTKTLGFVGIPLASSVVGLLYAATGFVLFLKLVKGLPLSMLAGEFAKITAATGIMAAVIIPLSRVVTDWPVLLHIIMIALVGAVLFIGTAWLLKTHSLQYLTGSLRSKTKQRET